MRYLRQKELATCREELGLVPICTFSLKSEVKINDLKNTWSIEKQGVPNLRLQSFLRVFSANGLFDLSDSQSKPLSIIFYDTDNLDSST